MGHPLTHRCRAARSMRKSISVVIPTWNSWDSLQYVLGSIALSSLNRLRGTRLQVVVSDDGSTDGTERSAGELGRELGLSVVVTAMEHRGQSAAINHGLSRAEGDVIVVCDSDMILTCGSLDELCARHELWPDVVCFGFRSPTSATPGARVLDVAEGLAHTEAFSRDNRVRFHMPSFVSNMMLATDWLRALTGGRFFLDCEGSVWRRHRYVFGALFSVDRDLLASVGGMPAHMKGWGYQDTLTAARLEANGGFLLPVTSVGGHHIEHDIRTAKQWFEYRRNGMAYEQELTQEWHPLDSMVTQPGPMPATVASDPFVDLEEAMSPLDAFDVYFALGDWANALSHAAKGTERHHECLYRARDFGCLLSEPYPSVWRSMATHAVGRTRTSALAGAVLDWNDWPTTSYARTASLPELRYLADGYRRCELQECAQLHEDAVRLFDTPG